MKGSLTVIFFLWYTITFSQEFRFAFGSCAKPEKDLSILDSICEHQPNVFAWLGDNVYADTEDKDTLCSRYAALETNRHFQVLRSSIPFIATWDDHDYGMNDAGKNFVLRDDAKQVFLDFFQISPCSARRYHEGIYTSYFLSFDTLTIQFIILDTRSFRDDLQKVHPDSLVNHPFAEYVPNFDSTATLLGKAQWEWLEKQLIMPADVRIICSSIQFSHSWNGFESWNNFPFEKRRFIELIACTKAEGVVVASGDVHFAELSKEEGNTYPIYDLTSSGLSSKWHSPVQNDHRIGTSVSENHFGIIALEKTPSDWEIHFQIWDKFNQQRMNERIFLKTLQVK